MDRLWLFFRWPIHEQVLHSSDKGPLRCKKSDARLHTSDVFTLEQMLAWSFIPFGCYSLVSLISGLFLSSWTGVCLRSCCERNTAHRWKRSWCSTCCRSFRATLGESRAGAGRDSRSSCFLFTSYVQNYLWMMSASAPAQVSTFFSMYIYMYRCIHIYFPCAFFPICVEAGSCEVGHVGWCRSSPRPTSRTPRLSSDASTPRCRWQFDLLTCTALLYAWHGHSSSVV